MEPILILAIGSWVLGYFITTHVISKRTTKENVNKIIVPPKWLYYLCGTPLNMDYPRGTMNVDGFRGQIFGLILGIYLVIVVLWKPSRQEFVIGFALCILLPMLLTYFISRRYFVAEKSSKGRKTLR